LEKSNFSHNSESGFSLIEVLVATGILAVALVSLAELFAISTKSNATAKNAGMTMILAEQKIEQLRGLLYGFDVSGLPIQDTQTDLAVYPPAASGGKGLGPSTENTIQNSVDGYVDYISSTGASLGGGTTVPAGTTYIRRWSVEPLPTNPNNVTVMQVLVTRRPDRGVANSGSVTRLPDEARLMSIRARKAQ
jgi:prepilin-type N-terminal cleavage/methylation domain-containing protein